MQVEVIIVLYQEGETRPPFLAPRYTSVYYADLTPQEVHELRARYQRVIFEFEQELRARGRWHPG